MIRQYLFQQMHNFIFIYDKLGLHVSAYEYVVTYYTTFKVFIYFD